MRSSRRLVLGHDRWRLDVLDLEPQAEPRALVVAGHAMFVDRRTLFRAERPCLARSLAEAGVRVLVPELRGRGASGPSPAEGGDWRYADLVADVGAYLELAREIAPALPLFVVGHSLFGHSAFAYLGTHPEAPVAGVVALGVNIWNRRFERSRLRWLAMRGYVEACMASVALAGYVPARRLRVGTADEAGSYFRDLASWVRTDSWRGADGTDFHANMARLRSPVLHVVSDGDRWLGRPEHALRFSAVLGDRREVLHLGSAGVASSLRGLVPDHMGLVTDPRCEALWQDLARWICARAG